MAIAIVRFLQDTAATEQAGSAGAQWGVLRNGHVFPVPQNFARTRDLIEAQAELTVQVDHGLRLEEVRLLSPIVGATRLLCQGMNYEAHREEVQSAPKGGNLLFLKDVSTVANPNTVITRPSGCRALDYEIELGLVIRRDVRGPQRIGSESLGEWVAGLVIANDISARDLMFGAPMIQWFQGKSQRGSCPLGPVLFLIDPREASLIDNLELKLWHNGTLKQNANTRDMQHKPASTLEEASRFMDLDAGDVLLTGTPGGVLLKPTPEMAKQMSMTLFDEGKRQTLLATILDETTFLQPGDQLRLSIRSPDGSVDLGEQHCVIASAQH